MTLKDWKKIGKDKWKKKIETIWIHDSWGLSISPKQLKKYPYTLWMKKNEDVKRKTFKTKSTALKYAKSYMRKH